MASAVFVLALVAFAAICSVSAAPDRIIGGGLTSIEQYPSLVAVESLNSRTWDQTCAGTILNRRNILSAAHCFSGWQYRPQNRRIRAGSSFRNTGGTVINVVREFNHPSYGIIRNDGDISVVRLATPLEYSPAVQRVTVIVPGFQVPDNSAVIQAGWGRTTANSALSSQLRNGTINTINWAVCRARYASAFPPRRVTDNMICTGNANGRDACDGDYGGPLYFGNVQVGVISWAIGCGHPFYPGVSTRIASYTDWIVSNAV